MRTPARLVYSVIFYLLMPFVLLRLLVRGVAAPGYLRRWPQRFGLAAGSCRR